MTYSVKSIYYTLQGEGVHTGRAAVFLRFSGCNLWSGREAGRANASCKFCDTDFVGTDGPGGGKFESANALAEAVLNAWQRHVSSEVPRPYLVVTGGEPLLQLDAVLVDALHAENFEIALETNGTLVPPSGIDWICCSPKAGASMVLKGGDELKLVFPQDGCRPENYIHLDFRHFFLQPRDGAEIEKNRELAIQYCLKNPRWRLSLQTHKILGIS